MFSTLEGAAMYHFQPETYVVNTATGEQLPVFKTHYPERGGHFMIPGGVRVKDMTLGASNEGAIYHGMACLVAVKYTLDGPVAVQRFYLEELSY